MHLSNPATPVNSLRALCKNPLLTLWTHGSLLSTINTSSEPNLLNPWTMRPFKFIEWIEPREHCKPTVSCCRLYQMCRASEPFKPLDPKNLENSKNLKTMKITEPCWIFWLSMNLWTILHPTEPTEFMEHIGPCRTWELGLSLWTSLLRGRIV